MINRQLLEPESIVVIGGSNNVHKPGGAVVRNLMSGGYSGVLRVVNPKEDEVQGIKAFHDARELPPTDLAILVVAARFCPDYVELLAKEKNVRAFIIISAGFSEETPEGAQLEQRILDTCEQYGCALIGSTSSAGRALRPSSSWRVPSRRACSSTACGAWATASR